jgi:hypothetical protein
MSSLAESSAVTPRWITVFHGPMAEVLVCQGLLESNGFRTHIVDENIKVIDPFITGANAFGVQLQVTEDDVAEAKKVLDYRPLPDEQAESQDRAEERVRELGLRIRWASIIGITAPYALWLARPYFLGVRALGRRPAEHAWTVAALVLSVVLILATLSRFVLPFLLP